MSLTPGELLRDLGLQLVDPGSYLRIGDPGYETSWVSVPMADDGLNGDAFAGDSMFTVELPPSLQTHRRLVRYRITVADGPGNSVRVPYADDGQPNFAYFVYDGVPSWTAAKQPGQSTPETIPASVLGTRNLFTISLPTRPM